MKNSPLLKLARMATKHDVEAKRFPQLDAADLAAMNREQARRAMIKAVPVVSPVLRGRDRPVAA